MRPKTLHLKQLQKTFVLQQDQSDCGVACLLSLINFYEGSNTLEKLRELSGTTKQGTTLLGLFQSANQLGFIAEGYEADLQALIDHGAPVILHVTIEDRLQHYVICYGHTQKGFIIGDPAKGVSYYSNDKLESIWKSKTCLVLTPNEDFVKEKQTKQDKKVWFLELLRQDYNLLGFSILLGLAIAGLGMVMAVFSQKLIDEILPSKDFNKLITGILLVGFLLLVRAAFTSLRAYFLIRQSKDFNNRIIDNFYDSLLRLPKPFFDTRKIGELVSRLNDTQRIQEVIQTVSNTFVINLLVSLVSLGFLYYYSWETGLIASVSLPFYFFLVYRFNTRIIKAQKEVMQTRAHSQSNYIATMDGIGTIKNNNKQTLFKRINSVIYGKYQDEVFNLGKINVRLSLISGVFSVLFLVGILSFTSLQVYHDALQLGELMAILGIAGSLLPSVAGLALIAIPINEAKVAFDRMYEFAAMQKEETGTENLKEFKELSVEGLSFRFPGRKPLLKNVNFKVCKGELIALVGESGSGKSTIGQILQKFYTPEAGKVLINQSITLKDVALGDWRDTIGVIEQDISLFNSTVLDNIVLGAEDTAENVVQFCQEYGFHQYIQSFPQGYATILGEEGINLSGGQKQIVALARALYKRPQLLILDEYTSAMDRKTEHFAMELLRSLKDKVGIVFISHRLHSLPKIADRIYVIEDGETKHNGTHISLMESNNFYSDFWKQLEDNFQMSLS